MVEKVSEQSVPVIDCKIGDKLKRKGANGEQVRVIGWRSVSGSVWTNDVAYGTITAVTAEEWSLL